MAQRILPRSRLLLRQTLFTCPACSPHHQRAIARWQSTDNKSSSSTAPNPTSPSPTTPSDFPVTETPSSESPASAPISPPSSQPPPPRPKRRIPTRLIYTTCFLILGAIFGTAFAGIIAPPAYPLRGSPEDQRLLTLLSQDLDNLPIIRELRKKCRSEAQIEAEAEKTGGVRLVERRVSERVRDKIDEEEGIDRSSRKPEWRELPTTTPISGSLLSAMSGIGGTGVQRLFYSTTEKQLLMITWIGSALCGWPGVCHGGAIATFFGETARAAIVEAARDGLSTLSPAAELMKMELDYMKQTNAGGFFAVRAQVKDDGESGEIKVVTQIQTLDGKPCAKAVTTWSI